MTYQTKGAWCETDYSG